MIRDVHTIDAQGKVLGRLASQIAILLRGKNKVTYQPHIDEGAVVRVNNVEKLVFTGNKLEKKKYYHHSGHVGGIKEIALNKLMRDNPAKVLRGAVYNMLPENRSRKIIIKRLQITK
jgi:large subunit ribosomal protein L13